MTLTPEQFNKIVTKDDLEEAIKKSEERISLKIDKVLTAVDGIAKKHKDFDEEMASNQVAHDRYEVRISHLEGKETVVRDEKGSYVK